MAELEEQRPERPAEPDDAGDWLRAGSLALKGADAVLVAELSPDGGPGPCLDANERACQILGLEREAVLARPLIDLLAQESEMAGRLQTALAGEREASLEMFVAAGDGRRFPAEISLQRLDLPGQRLVICLLRDVTELLRLEANRLRARLELEEHQRRLQEDLKGAAVIQQSLLPQSGPRIGQVEIAWEFVPCEMVGGDLFNVFSLDEKRLGLYMLDVSGHGVPAAMIAVSVYQMLQPGAGSLLKRRTSAPPFYEITSPQEVLVALDKEFPFERFNKFFTLTYLVLNLAEGGLVYSTAGHPPPILVPARGEPQVLSVGGSVVGLGGLVPFVEQRLSLSHGDRVILYTDGLIEHANLRGEMYGLARFQQLIRELRRRPLSEMLAQTLHEVMAFGGSSRPRDDVSLLAVEYRADGVPAG